MKILFYILLSFLLLQNASANDFSKKKIIKIGKNDDVFRLIDLNQEIQNENLSKQKAIFDSSILKEKPSPKKDQDIDFALFVSYKANFAYAFENFKVLAQDFSLLFAQNFVHSTKLNFINADANRIYQNQKTFNAFSPKDSRILDASRFLKKEKNKNQIYAKFIDYLLVINLNDFYIELTNFLTASNKNAYVLLNYKIISTSTGKIISAKNVKLKLTLSKQANSQKNYKEITEQMPLLLNKVLEKELKKLKL